MLYFDSELKSFAQIETLSKTVEVLNPPNINLKDYALYFDQLNKQVYVVGGVDVDSGEISKRVFRYDIINRKWSELPEMLESRR